MIIKIFYYLAQILNILIMIILSSFLIMIILSSFLIIDSIIFDYNNIVNNFILGSIWIIISIFNIIILRTIKKI